MGRTTESSPGSSRSTAEPTGGCTVPVGSLVLLVTAPSRRSPERAVGGVPVDDAGGVGLGSAQPQSGQRRGRRPRQKDDSVTVGTSGPEAGGTLVPLSLFETCRVSTTLVIRSAGTSENGHSEINTARKCERPRRSLYDDMPDAVQDGGDRGVQDSADRRQAVTALASRWSASTTASAAVSGRAEATHTTVTGCRHPIPTTPGAPAGLVAQPRADRSSDRLRGPVRQRAGVTGVGA